MLVDIDQVRSGVVFAKFAVDTSAHRQSFEFDWIFNRVIVLDYSISLADSDDL
jgi:hypothetical protein